MDPINTTSSYLQFMLPTAFEKSGLSLKSPAAPGSAPVRSETHYFSPLAQMLSVLHQLQQSDPAKYRQLTAQIAANLQTAAQTAQAKGNASAAAQLSQLSTDFSNASKNGQLPNVPDLAQAVGGHHHGHHFHHAPAASSSDPSSADQGPSHLQLFAVDPPNGPFGPLTNIDPLTIIENTLSSAGITVGKS